MSEVLLSAKGVHKTYTLGQRALEVLRGVDIELARGDFLALRGASGAGKSTLLHLLGGLDTVDRGRVVVSGVEMNRQRDMVQFLRHEVGFVFQLAGRQEPRGALRPGTGLAAKHRGGLHFSSLLPVARIGRPRECLFAGAHGAKARRAN